MTSSGPQPRFSAPKARPSRIPFWVAGLGGIGVVGWLDVVTGPELAFSVVYFLPISLLAWQLGRAGGLVGAGASAVTWFVIDVIDHAYSHTSIPVWNGFMRLTMFVVLALLLDRARSSRDTERALARTDPLTHAANSRAFYDRLEQEIERSRRSRQPFALVYFDLDDFKAVNDSAGHVVGDQILQAVARTAIETTRQTDLVARLGGDEFSVLLWDTGERGAALAVAKLREALVRLADERGWRVGFSLGAAVFLQPPGSVREAVQIADELMYSVKRAGKNGVAQAVFPPDPGAAKILARTEGAG